MKYLWIVLLLVGCEANRVRPPVFEKHDVIMPVAVTCEVKRPEKLELQPIVSDNILIQGNYIISENILLKQYIKEIEAIISKCIKFIN